MTTSVPARESAQTRLEAAVARWQALTVIERYDLIDGLERWRDGQRGINRDLDAAINLLRAATSP